MYDSGEVLQGLEEQWSFMGANLMEWSCGVVVFMIIGTVADNAVKVLPLMLIGALATSFSLGSLRRIFPDEHRGVRNMLTSALGFPPVDIPPPARLQPIWSASPVRHLPTSTQYMKLGLDVMFAKMKQQAEPESGNQ